jgi:hypothetical protein
MGKYVFEMLAEWELDPQEIAVIKRARNDQIGFAPWDGNDYQPSR